MSALNLLLLRGLSREARHWGEFPEAVQRRRSDVRVWTLDLPGVASAMDRPVPPSSRGTAADLRARWLELAAHTPGPWAILGVSFGGMVTMEWLSQHPADFRRAVLVNSSAANVALPFERLRPAALAALIRSAREADPEVRERHVLGVVANHPDRRAAAHPAWSSYARTHPIPLRVFLGQIAAASRFRAPAALPIPALVVVSSADRLTHPACSERLAARFSAAVERHPSAGHDVALDDPSWLADRVVGWLESSGALERGA